MKICKKKVGSLLKHQQHAYPGPTYSFWKLKETFTLISFEELIQLREHEKQILALLLQLHLFIKVAHLCRLTQGKSAIEDIVWPVEYLLLVTDEKEQAPCSYNNSG